MIFKAIVGITTILYSFAANAQTLSSTAPSSKTAPDPARILERMSASSPLTQCAAMASTAEGAAVYTMANGASYEFAHADGRVVSVTAIAPGGQRVKVDAAEKTSDEPSSKVAASPEKNEEQRKLRADINRAMEKFLKAQCARFALREQGEAPADLERPEQQLSSAPETSDLIKAYSGNWAVSDYLGFADLFTYQMSESGFTEWENYAEFAGRGGQTRPSCTVVVKECSDFCSNVGQLEYSGCGGLALAAGFTLGPPTGAAVGFYCSGNAYLATEQCKRRCQTPTVVCGWN